MTKLIEYLIQEGKTDTQIIKRLMESSGATLIQRQSHKKATWAEAKADDVLEDFLVNSSTSEEDIMAIMDEVSLLSKNIIDVPAGQESYDFRLPGDQSSYLVDVPDYGIFYATGGDTARYICYINADLYEMSNLN